jgi:putative transposase
MGAAVWLEVLVVWSFLYLALRRVLELLVLCWRSAEAKEVELLVLRHQLAILPPPARSRWSVLVVTPQTLRRWHRRIVRRHWTDPAPARGRPPLPDSVQTVIVRLATENPRWGYQRIRGELLPLGRWASGSSIAGFCAPPASSRHQLELPGPGPRRSFLGRQAAGILACDFLTVDTAFRQPRSVLVFIHCTIGASTSPASPPTPPVPGWPSKPQPRRRAG